MKLPHSNFDQHSDLKTFSLKDELPYFEHSTSIPDVVQSYLDKNNLNTLEAENITTLIKFLETEIGNDTLNKTIKIFRAKISNIDHLAPSNEIAIVSGFSVGAFFYFDNLFIESLSVIAISYVISDLIKKNSHIKETKNQKDFIMQIESKGLNSIQIDKINLNTINQLTQLFINCAITTISNKYHNINKNKPESYFPSYRRL